MTHVIPHRFLFRYRIPVQHLPHLPGTEQEFLNLPEDCILPDFSELDGAASFGEIRMAWSVDGIGISVTIRGKRQPPRATATTPWDSDGLQIWIDTRNTQSVHRGTRFCHHFCLLPAGGGKQEQEPVVVQLPIARARDDAPLAKPEAFEQTIGRFPEGYQLNVWLPADALHGFDPESSPLLGFYYHLRDAELGEQFLGVGQEFPFAYDPSLWATLELNR